MIEDCVVLCQLIVSFVLKQLNYFPASILFTCLLYDIIYELTEVVTIVFIAREILEVKQVRMFGVLILLCLSVVCQVSLVRAFVRSCVPRSDEDMVLQQVRFLLLLSELFPVLSPELEAPSLVYASTPHVLPGSVIGQWWDSRSVSSALVLVCVRIVHYI